MSELGDKFELLVTEKEEREKVISAKSCWVRLYKALKNETSRFDSIKTGGSFDTVDAEIKTFLLLIETQFDDLQNTLEGNAAFMEIIGGGEPIE